MLAERRVFSWCEMVDWFMLKTEARSVTDISEISRVVKIFMRVLSAKTEKKSLKFRIVPLFHLYSLVYKNLSLINSVNSNLNIFFFFFYAYENAFLNFYKQDLSCHCP